jgi:hypothetical protein
VCAFKKLYDSWGPRLENLLRYAVFVAVEQQGTLLDMLRLLTDKAFRDSAVFRISDDVVRSFWIQEFASWNAHYRTEAVYSVTNKLMPFLTSRQLRVINSPTPSSSSTTTCRYPLVIATFECPAAARTSAQRPPAADRG